MISPYDTTEHRCTEVEQGRRLESLASARSDSYYGKATDLGPTALIIAPASVVENWAREFDTWTYLSVGVYKPSTERSSGVLKDFRRGRLDVGKLGFDAPLLTVAVL